MLAVVHSSIKNANGRRGRLTTKGNGAAQKNKPIRGKEAELKTGRSLFPPSLFLTSAAEAPCRMQPSSKADSIIGRESDKCSALMRANDNCSSRSARRPCSPQTSNTSRHLEIAKMPYNELISRLVKRAAVYRCNQNVPAFQNRNGTHLWSL